MQGLEAFSMFPLCTQKVDYSPLVLNKKTMTRFLVVPLKPAESLNISDVLGCFAQADVN